ncbi:MAG TPA: hypothetical protein VF006_09105 [Longimicrobium sp.]
MPNILDSIARSRTQIRPRSEAEFIALQIARSLDDEQNAADYPLLSHRYTIPALVHACASVRQYRKSGWPVLPHFRAVLEEQSGKEPGLPNLPLLAIRIERRCVALVAFHGLRLEYARTRNIPLVRAEATVAGFIRWALTQFAGASVVLEQKEAEESKRSELLQTAVEVVRAAGVPLWEIPETELFEAFGQPGCKTRGQFRAAANHIFPTLRTRFCGRAGLDAAGLALLVQSRRLLGQTEVTDPKR